MALTVKPYMVYMTEHQEQATLFSLFTVWGRPATVGSDMVAKTNLEKYPALHLAHSIPNDGNRHKKARGIMMAQGLRAGVPDMMLPVSRLGFHGLYIEMKRRLPTRGTVKPDQKKWLTALSKEGYLAAACWGYEAAWLLIKAYLDESPLRLQELESPDHKNVRIF